MIPLTYGVAPTLPQINTVLLDLPSGAEQNFFFFSVKASNWFENIK